MNECTSIDEPFCLYDAENNKDKKTFKGPGVLICSIDNMPTQLPREATDFFGELLLPHVENILKSSADKDFDEADSAGITPLRHVPIWKGSERTLYDLAAYIKDKVDAMKDGKPPPDLTDYAMEGFAPLSL